MPLIALTHLWARGSNEQLNAAGISEFLNKPIRQAQLLDIVGRVLGRPQLLAKKLPAASQFDATLGARRPLRILLADDNPVNQKVGGTLLKKLGYQADLALNGVEALAALERQRYDIVFMDVQMPEMDGYQATAEIRKRWSANQRPRIIAVTGNGFAGDREKCLAAGMDDFLLKPIRIADLVAKLEHWSKPENLAA